MPSTRSGDPPIKLPTCETCGVVMRLQSVAPNERYSNLSNVTFACDCGQTIEQFVADKD